MLSAQTVSARRLALVGLAKNTGKTEALAALLRELEALRKPVGVTSVGRDGEEHDVIDFRIEKPRVVLAAGSLVATTDELLRSSGIPYELLEQTDVRTPLGRVLIARLRGPGAIEVAGPSAAEQVRAVSDAMLAHGVEQVLIDGAIDRRAASSPDVADGLVMSTGAVLGEDLGEVVEITRGAVELVRLALVSESSSAGAQVRALAGAADGHTSALVGDGGEPPVALPPRFALTAESAQILATLQDAPWATGVYVAGALPDRFLRELLTATKRLSRPLTVVVGDATRVFLADRGLDWYRAQGIEIEALRPIELLALTVNPVAPQSHRFDSGQMRARLAEAIAGVPIYDVMHPEYRGSQQPVAL